MLRYCSVQYLVEIHEPQTELGVFETGVSLILGHDVVFYTLNEKEINIQLSAFIV